MEVSFGASLVEMEVFVGAVLCVLVEFVNLSKLIVLVELVSKLIVLVFVISVATMLEGDVELSVGDSLVKFEVVVVLWL